MKKIKLIAVGLYLGVLFQACAILEPVDTKKYGSINDYKFAYIKPTESINSGVGVGFGNGGAGGFFMGGANVNKSLNPSSIISGVLIKKGLIIVDSIKDQDKTLIVNYGQGEKRNVIGGLGGYTLGVTIQMIKASTNEPVYICSAEGQGETEVDDIREAISRCLSELD
ncbi:DUF4136 domain-containing protein [Helicobacter sp. MIT 00-7814]|uniref:DUF4136 domain-containing protein n=1 Tax=unclassified Helicobacter TaxID=2593540 RepID=UPI000E1F05B7|nr:MULTISPECIES: DUF4136 domain-containing protein [unclassified Helicobacter]RDU52982.1 DUF4136 domain-containing protein [Helicobacter sp. MIT 00-7814]RDU53858.1 DUF4136 domain-containing protein [Helicobacter sp. MIT 99-10781]